MQNKEMYEKERHTSLARRRKVTLKMRKVCSFCCGGQAPSARC